MLQFTNVVHLKEIKFLVHESVIPQRLDLYTYIPSGEQANTARIPLNQIDFKKMGYLNLNSNERSLYRVRELKSVYTNIKTLLLKVVLNAPYSNEHNHFKQVSLIAITCMGQMDAHMPGLGLSLQDLSTTPRGNPDAAASSYLNSGRRPGSAQKPYQSSFFAPPGSIALKNAAAQQKLLNKIR